MRQLAKVAPFAGGNEGTSAFSMTNQGAAGDFF
jgi:hypothetical protein